MSETSSPTADLFEQSWVNLLTKDEQIKADKSIMIYFPFYFLTRYSAVTTKRLLMSSSRFLWLEAQPPLKQIKTSSCTSSTIGRLSKKCSTRWLERFLTGNLLILKSRICLISNQFKIWNIMANALMNLSAFSPQCTYPQLREWRLTLKLLA